MSPGENVAMLLWIFMAYFVWRKSDVVMSVYMNFSSWEYVV